MSNLVFMSVCFKGDQRQLKSLYGKMKRLQERKEPLVKNDYYHSKQWLGNLVKRLGANYNSVYCRGTWDCLKMNEKTLYFTTETASQPPFRLLKLIASVYPSLSFYFEAEGDDWDCLLTNDVEGIFFPYHYLVDSDMGYEYFIELEEAGEAIREIIKELAKKPIVIKILNIRVDTARDLVFKIYKEV